MGACGESSLRGMSAAMRVSLLRWLRRQLREPTVERERLEAAIQQNDPAEARRLVARAAFSDVQRRHVEHLLAEWERSLPSFASHDLDPPGGA